MIKIIVNYTVSNKISTSIGYKDDKLALIFTFRKLDEITNSSINSTLREVHIRGTITITNMKQIV